MLQISKYTNVSKKLGEFSHVIKRFKHTKDENCCLKCPPSYECKRPQKDDDYLGVKVFIRERQNFLKCPSGHGNGAVWRNIFFFVCVPIILLQMADMFILNEEKFKRPKFVEYPYLRIRYKEFPWHPTKTLFHNPKVNALPDGYEVQVPEDEEYDA